MGNITPARHSHILDRRRRVAALRLRGLTIREIAQALTKGDSPIYNPDTGRAYGETAIAKDIRWLEEQWRGEAMGHLSLIKAKHLAELREVRRAAWQTGKLFYVLKSLEQEAKVAGLNEVTDVHFNMQQNNFDLSGMPTDELRRIAELIDSSASGAIPSQHTERVIEAG